MIIFPLFLIETLGQDKDAGAHEKRGKADQDAYPLPRAEYGGGGIAQEEEEQRHHIDQHGGSEDPGAFALDGDPLPGLRLDQIAGLRFQLLLKHTALAAAAVAAAGGGPGDGDLGHPVRQELQYNGVLGHGSVPPSPAATRLIATMYSGSPSAWMAPISGMEGTEIFTGTR